MEKWIPGYKRKKPYSVTSRKYNKSSGLIEIDIKKELDRIKSSGFIPTMRKGDNGIGYTLETLLGLRETNTRGKGDFSYKGIQTELKSQRKDTSSMMTLFTLEPKKETLKDRDMINKYGYLDSKGRQGLKITLDTKHFVPQGLKISVDYANDKLSIIDQDDNISWYWTITDLEIKIGSLVIVFAERRGRGKTEEFHYVEAHHLNGLDPDKLLSLFDENVFVIDLRMHLRHNNTVRNHGTAFRIRDMSKLIGCYEVSERLI
jgi:hypothetical protein